jgi:hypothetical protein
MRCWWRNQVQILAPWYRLETDLAVFFLSTSMYPPSGHPRMNSNLSSSKASPASRQVRQVVHGHARRLSRQCTNAPIKASGVEIGMTIIFQAPVTDWWSVPSRSNDGLLLLALLGEPMTVDTTPGDLRASDLEREADYE